MREISSLITTPTVKPTLEVVRHRFEAWRKRRGRRGRIPEALWEAAVGLCREYSLCEVSRSLRVNYNDLKDRTPKVKGMGLALGKDSALGFVKLDLGAPIGSSECLVEMEAPNGVKMRMSLRGSLREVDPVELGRAFWRQGR